MVARHGFMIISGTIGTKNRCRDAHETFFTPPCSRKRESHEKSKTPWFLTDKERRAAAIEYWDLNYGMPEILGHNADHYQLLDQFDQTLLPPINFCSRIVKMSTTYSCTMKILKTLTCLNDNTLTNLSIPNL